EERPAQPRGWLEPATPGPSQSASPWSTTPTEPDSSAGNAGFGSPDTAFDTPSPSPPTSDAPAPVQDSLVGAESRSSTEEEAYRPEASDSRLTPPPADLPPSTPEPDADASPEPWIPSSESEAAD